ncbi:hypothetical protein ASPVEDRAFT_33952 [Aspergillus versicolor CBS 583.65]|uniref:ER-bound oxygenase mpaB/mpaB'/Rubber oxygenase catalytic domain-containing protein n=1 Tax=Aspergillus versicolor CBS 583.65 TaxID=1036611 RepID=A0A1L9Q206_ASPVE|nr:uncharacterized protein ASPVEDRAFT_33952 [Aspergillus versicolor CBS 583.65]OJJ07761.1 hypothetical protein ASPVEDRAFT_33952 [Aspergillus versicolor CBS 583.65]
MTISAPPKPRKWIQQRIESLHPDVDYEEIWRLTSSYGLTGFTQNLVYAITFPNFIVTQQGAEAVWRSDGGKILWKATQRVEQTANNNAIWWWYGPSNPITKKSVSHINNVHAYWAQRYPGNFSENDDYLYTLTYSAAAIHRLMVKLGLPGFTDKQKAAAVNFWRELGTLFIVPEGDKRIHSFPGSWDELMAYNLAFESNMRVGPERAKLIAEACFDQFAFSYFPRGLRWLGRRIPIALSLPTTLRACQIEPVHPVLYFLITLILGRVLWLVGMFAADPTESYWEQQEKMTVTEKREKIAALRKEDAEFAPWFIARHKRDIPGCPFHSALGLNKSSAGSTLKDFAIERHDKKAA